MKVRDRWLFLLLTLPVSLPLQLPLLEWELNPYPRLQLRRTNREGSPPTLKRPAFTTADPGKEI
jgi:hypothetical protein